MTLQALHMGDAVVSDCPACRTPREVYPVYAMDGGGVLQIAAVTMCHICGPALRCLIGACSAVLPADGELAHRHVQAVHAA